jgi:FixJ family two-component response regulator
VKRFRWCLRSPDIVAIFADGESFIAAARVHPPTAVLLDLNPPDKSGLVVLKEIDAQNYPAPIFIISGDGDIAHAVAAAANGSVAFDLRRSTRH